MDLSNFSNRDAKIIRDNPTKTPFELVRLGLSPRAFERLLNESKEAIKEEKPPIQMPPAKEESEGSDKPKEMQAESVQQVIMNQPNRVNDYRPANSSGQRTVVGPTGLPQKMNAKRAIQLTTKYPNEYKLID